MEQLDFDSLHAPRGRAHRTAKVARGLSAQASGAAAERLVEGHYAALGCEILARRWRGLSGEIDLILPLDPGTATFDGRPAGWCVYPPGSAHRPTVAQGRALVLYLLPEGQIQFTKS